MLKAPKKYRKDEVAAAVAVAAETREPNCKFSNPRTLEERD